MIAGRDVRVPGLAYSRPNPSRLARFWQMGNSVCNLLFSAAGAPKTLVSGGRLAYLAGEVEYFTGDLLPNAFHFLCRRQPFFILSGTGPAAAIASLTGCDAVPAPKLRLSTHCAVVIIANWNACPAVLHYGVCGEARAEIRRAARGLVIAASDPRLKHLIPSLAFSGPASDGAALMVQSRVPGVSPGFSWRRVDATAELWLAGPPARAVAGRPRLGQELTEVYDTFPAYRDSLSRAGTALLGWHAQSRMAGDITHGDLWLGNVLFSGDAVAGIVDWEWARTDGVRSADLLHLILMSYSELRGTHVAHYLRQLWADTIGDRALKERLETLRLRVGMDTDDLKFVALLRWFDYLRENAQRGRLPGRAWSENVISRTLPVIRDWLRRHD